MKITEKVLLDNYSCLSNGLSNISTIDGKDICWNYRKGLDTEGFNPVVESRSDAKEIFLEIEIGGFRMIKLDEGCEDHPSLGKIEHDRETAFNEVCSFSARHRGR